METINEEEISNDVYSHKCDLLKMEHEKQLDEPKVNFVNIFVFSVAVALGGFTLGWDVGTIGNMVSTDVFQFKFGQLKDGVMAQMEYYKIGIVISSFNFGCLFGCLFLSKLADKYGFKPLIGISNFIYLIGTSLQFASFYIFPYFAAIIIGRILCGVTCGTMCVVVPRYINQLVPLKEKGLYLSLFQTIICFAILLGSFNNLLFKDNFVPLWSVQILYSLKVFGLLFIIPESPFFLNKLKSKKMELYKVYEKIYVKPNTEQIEKQINQISEYQEKKENCSSNTGKLAKYALCCVIMGLQQFTGINYFFYYGSIIFGGLGINPFVVNIALGLVNLSGSFVSNLIVGKFSKRKLLVIGSSIMGFLLLIYMIIEVLGNEDLSVYMVIIACMFIFAFSITWGPVPGIIVAYVSQNEQNIIGMAICTNYLMNCIVTVVTPIMVDIANYSVLIIFVFSLASSVLLLQGLKGYLGRFI